MPTHEDKGDLVRMYMKSSMRQGGRYQRRALYDTHIEEGEDIWTVASLDSDHPMRNMKKTIAGLTALPYQAVVASIPGSLYKNAASGGMGHSYELKSIGSDWDSHNADAQSTEQPILSKIEQVGLMRVKHKLPPRWEYDASGTQNAQAVMQPRKKIKTHYALGGKNNAATFNDGRRNYTDLHTLKSARQNYGQNRGIYGAPTPVEYQEAVYSNAKKQALMSKETFDDSAGVAKALYGGNKMSAIAQMGKMAAKKLAASAAGASAGVGGGKRRRGQ